MIWTRMTQIVSTVVRLTAWIGAGKNLKFTQDPNKEFPSSQKTIIENIKIVARDDSQFYDRKIKKSNLTTIVLTHAMALMEI